MHSARGVGGYCCGLPGMESGRRAELAHGGTYALMYSGNDLSATGSYSYNRIFDVHAPLTAGTADQIRIGFDRPAATGLFRGYVDDIQIVRPAM